MPHSRFPASPSHAPAERHPAAAGALEIAINPYAVFESGIIGVRGMYTCDVGVRYGAAFAIGTGITG